MIHIALTNEQTVLEVDEKRLCAAVRIVLEDADRPSAEISVAVVDDRTIHGLNRKYLDHDYATDVLSFLLDDDDEHLDGEVIVSAETAAATAAEFGWPAADELLLYVVHGALHLVGYDDKTPEATAKMRTRETNVLARFDVEPRYKLVDHGPPHISRPHRHEATAASDTSDISEGDVST